jgi:hypothetical protein
MEFSELEAIGKKISSVRYELSEFSQVPEMRCFAR